MIDSWPAGGMSIDVAAEGTAVEVELSAPWRFPPTRNVDMMNGVMGNGREEELETEWKEGKERLYASNPTSGEDQCQLTRAWPPRISDTVRYLTGV